jgi:pimeloyl-ACP methyl ester carboxylesterase
LNRRGFASRFYGDEGNQVHVYEYANDGSGEPFVMLHGLGTNAAAYAPVLARLMRSAKSIIAPELPGHGFSDYDRSRPTPKESFIRIAKLLDELIDEPVVLAGTSLGGAVALKYALHSPHKVKQLFLVSPAGAPMSEAGFDQVRSHFQVETAADGRAFMRRLFHKPPWYTSIIGGSVTRMLNQGAVRIFLDPKTEVETLTREDIQALKPRTLLLWGTEERLLPDECLDWYRANMPANVRILRPQNYGHSPHLEFPGDLASRLIEFATGVEGT